MSDWQPIQDAPRDCKAIFWLRPIAEDDMRPAHAWICHYGGWSSFWKATDWMPIPDPPQRRGATHE